jgi:hypothetical protein
MNGDLVTAIAYLFVLGLLKSGLVVLGSSTHELLLDEVDTCETCQSREQGRSDKTQHSPLST